MRWLRVLGGYPLFWGLFPFLLVYRKTRGRLRQRLGYYRKAELPPKRAARIWMHGASAGDLLALAPMFAPLRARLPDCSIACSTITNTGLALLGGQKFARTVEGGFAAPYDLPGATRRAVRGLAPHVLVLEYLELWPNLIHAAQAAGAKVVITNGRISEKNLGRYRMLFRLIGNPFRQVDLLLMRTAEDAERVVALGASPDRVEVTGSTKFDALAPLGASENPALREALGASSGDPLWIAGSTHEGEEADILAVHRKLREASPRLRLVIAPRYVDRAPKIAELARAQGFTARRRTEPVGSEQVVVLDTIGELASAYACARVAFVGGSFTPRGGQNILEPAARGIPVLFGPRMENFTDCVAVLAGRGGIQVENPVELFTRVSGLLGAPADCQRLGEQAAAAVRSVSGASARNAERIAALVGS